MLKSKFDTPLIQYPLPLPSLSVLCNYGRTVLISTMSHSHSRAYFRRMWSLHIWLRIYFMKKSRSKSPYLMFSDHLLTFCDFFRILWFEEIFCYPKSLGMPGSSRYLTFLFYVTIFVTQDRTLSKTGFLVLNP